MGISIHYNGRLKEAASLKNLIEEVKDIVSVHGWNFFVYEEEFPDNNFQDNNNFENIYGLSFSPGKSEPVHLSFLSNGIMVEPFRIEYFANSPNEEERQYIYTISTKTQYAGYKIHQYIIHLFRYLNIKYFEGFTMTDEAEYWETNDEKLLIKKFKFLDTIIDGLGHAFSSSPVQEGQSLEEHLKEIIERYYQYLKK